MHDTHASIAYVLRMPATVQYRCIFNFGF